MKKIGAVIGNMGKTEILSTRVCPKCNREVKRVRMQIIGGENKGKWQEYENECDCRLAQETMEAEKLRRHKYFEQFCIVPKELEKATLENFKVDYSSQGEALANAMDFFDQFTGKENLYFYGRTGRGKTHLAVGLYKYFKQNNITAMFFDVPKLMETIVASWENDSGYSESKFMKAIAEVDVLILDDLGVERISEWVDQTIYSILNQRQGKSIVFTSNIHPGDLTKRYGERIADRIKNKMSQNQLISIVTPESYRTKDLTMFKD
ncbi:ATP-binding protein [Sutcliffiella halmapala]|uniref:ATP-binding protein n=1 Tax=Sutcliffiella halmapala TaxID=79882 RepID=UPI00099590A2|nr:AFG1/ZapE family ATPase [Sutcliffiella halmapala]